jgi:hypothetical protein
MSTCAQPQERPTQQISFSLHLTGESSGVSHHLNSLHRGEQYTHHMGSFTPHRGTHRFISVSERTTYPTHGIPHPKQGHTYFHLCLREELHTHLMCTPNSWDSSPHIGAHNVPSPSQRGTTHPSHGHIQLMVSLTGRLTQSMSWRMSHAAIIINNHSHLFLV